MTTTKPWKTLRDGMPDTPERRAAYEQGRREVVEEVIAENLAELRKMRDLTQVEVARVLGIAQSTLSATEHRTDWQLSTLREFVEAIGGRLEVVAVFGDDLRVPLSMTPSDGSG